VSSGERLAAVISAIAAVGLPTIGFMIRMSVKWTQMGDRLTAIAEDMDALVKDKDRTHKEMLEQMREDRHATNERLTWLERNLWNRGGGDTGVRRASPGG
jgi:hypothetical protein